MAMTHDEMIAVIAAHRDRKKIEARNYPNPQYSIDLENNSGKWFIPSHHSFNFQFYEYRIAPEPPKPREWWLRLSEETEDVVIGGFTFGPSHPTNAIHVREVLPSTGEESAK